MRAIKTPPLPLQNLRWWPIPRRIQVIVAVAVAVALGLRAQWYFVNRVELRTGLKLWAFAVAFFLYGLWQARGALLDGGMSEWAADRLGKLTLPRLTEAALFAVVLGVGIFFRFYRIGDIPPGLNHDAAFHGLYAIRINRGIGYAPVVECCGQVAHETTLAYIIAGYQRLVGYTAFAIELAAISVGIATLVVFYFLMRRMFDHWVALVATFLLGVCGWHITFSRVGWHCILVPLFEALTFYLLLLALDSKRVRYYLLAGVALGLSLYTYDAGKTIPLSVAVFLVYMLIRNRSLILSRLRLFAAYGVAALVAFVPLGWYIHNHWDGYLGRSRSLWIGHRIEAAGSWAPLWHNIGDTLLIFNFRAHGDDFFIREPLLDVPVSVFFVLGLAYSLTRLKRPEHFLLLTMLVLSLLNGFLSVPNGNRALGAVLPVAAYAALFLVVAWRWLRQAFPPLAQYSSLGLVAVLVLSAYSTFHGYLGPDRRVQWGFYPEATRVGRYVKTIADDYEVHLAAGNWPRNTMTYLSYGGEGDPFTWRYTYTQNATDFLGMAPAQEKGTAFIIEAVPNNQSVINELRRRYPDAKVDNIYYPDGSNKAIAVALLVPPSATPKPPEKGEANPTTAGAAERDQQRRTALMQITAALVDYQKQTGSFPDTGGSIQTACAYLDLDKLCVLRDKVGIDTLVDPRGDVHQYGYWYQSNGKSFVLYASFESPVLPNEACTADDPGLASKPYLVCVRVGNP